MFETLKIIHMFCLFGGGAAGIGNGILLTKVMQAGGPPPDYVRATMKTLGMIGLASIVLLWLSGIAMIAVLGLSIDLVFAVKLIGAAVTLGAVSTMSVLSARAQAAGTPPPLARIKGISRLAALGAAVAVVFGVIAFG